ncbi:MAG: protein kinase [Candidatus Obscuribacterales bacterium]|nr:protein kinase [Candidatus Obscuribacterales bacterium]
MSGNLFTNQDSANEVERPSERPASKDPLVGTTLDGRFYIEEVLGSGGMSVVYKAKQLRVNRYVAIKTIRMQLDSKPVYKERFQREISSLCALNHPNVVTVYDCVIGSDDQPYIVMDYLRGRSLEALIKSDGPLNLERFASIAIQVCAALDHAHKKGIIHRDLKPGNVVLLDDETDIVKVVDFGLAKLSEDNRKLTHSGELWGSPPYMSPEQCMGESGDERSDIYSLGCVMYEMATGLDPFADANTVFELINRHVHASPPPFFQVNPNVVVPLKLEAVIFKALEKIPNDRFQSAHELQNAIVEACSGESGNLQFHPSRTGRSSGSIEFGGIAPPVTPEESGARSAQSQQVAWFAGMLNSVDPNEFSQQEPQWQNRSERDKTIDHVPEPMPRPPGSVTTDIAGISPGGRDLRPQSDSGAPNTPSPSPYAAPQQHQPQYAPAPPSPYAPPPQSQHSLSTGHGANADSQYGAQQQHHQAGSADSHQAHTHSTSMEQGQVVQREQESYSHLPQQQPYGNQPQRESHSHLPQQPGYDNASGSSRVVPTGSVYESGMVRGPVDQYAGQATTLSHLRDATTSIENPLKVWIPVLIVVGIIIGLGCALLCMPHNQPSTTTSQTTVTAPATESADTKDDPQSADEKDDDPPAVKPKSARSGRREPSRAARPRPVRKAEPRHTNPAPKAAPGKSPKKSDPWDALRAN